MSIWTSLLGLFLPTNVKAEEDFAFELSDDVQFLIGFAGTFRLPLDFVLKDDDSQTVLLENKRGSVLLRLTNFTAERKDGVYAGPAAVQAESAKGYMFKSGDEDRFFIIQNRDEVSSDESIFYSSLLGFRNTVVLVSFTVDPRLLKLTDKEVIDCLSKIAASIEVFDAADLPDRNGVATDVFETAEKLNNFTSDEILQLQQIRGQASRLVNWAGYAYPANGIELDQLFIKIVDNPNKFNGLENTQAVLGVAFGDYLVSEYGFKWNYVEDESKRDLAVVYSNSVDDLKVFPIDVVQWRNSVADAGFLSAIENTIIQRLSPED